MFQPTIIEWAAFLVGTTGTILWALGKNQLTVSVLWMISSVLWIIFALGNEHYALTSRDLLGILLYSVGIKTYWKTKNKEKIEKESVQSKIDEIKNGASSLLCDFCKNENVEQSKDKNIFTCSCIKN